MKESLNELSLKLKKALVNNLLEVDESELDKPYVASSRGVWSRRFLATEIENETELGIEQMEMLFGLTIDLIERGKETIEKFEN